MKVNRVTRILITFLKILIFAVRSNREEGKIKLFSQRIRLFETLDPLCFR